MDVNYQPSCPRTIGRTEQRTPPPAPGFTLIELLATVAVSAILLALALPSFSDFIQNQQLTSNVDSLIGDLYMARSAAITRSRRVLVCKSSDLSHCDHFADWSDGWIIFPDRDADNKRDENETVLRTQSALADGYDLQFASFGSSNYVRYYPDGHTLNSGFFTFCDPRGAPKAKAVIIFRTGRVRTDTVNGNGDKLQCPG